MNNLEVRLNITNYNPHPENPNYTVYHFFREDMAKYFEQLLNENNIPFESFIEEGEKTMYLFAIKNTFQKHVLKLNYTAIGKYREGFIPNRVGAISLIVIVLILVIISVIGYLKS